MFEKSLYDLIRGLRSHRGNEREYVLHSIRECRSEIKGSDMDLKAIALLKLMYLEMFGHDMSWASFHVLEVMSSNKYLQKRVGYLGAIQSFRPDTEVLMLATNMLKKDITSASVPTISLPLIALPHIVTPSLALSLMADLLPRLGHSSPNIRKKTVVAMYRIALTYPETLRAAWPKVKELLMNDQEEPSVTAAVVNVVCELCWRRPQDFLSLAPRLFDLLVDGGNNWMAIKIIKLFATLTPLEPRLVKKLLPPLTNLIRTTQAMSLLHECISGIIQGGILRSSDLVSERDEVAQLCVTKLREMIASDGDPNLKYVALLAFKQIMVSHPDLVANHQDVVSSCIDDPDTSIRFLALELESGLINSQNLQTVVNSLIKQLQDTSIPVFSKGIDNDYGLTRGFFTTPDIENSVNVYAPTSVSSDPARILPSEYRAAVVQHVLEMCYRDSYTNVSDFKWYIDVLLKLVHVLPSEISTTSRPYEHANFHSENNSSNATTVGAELRNIAVRVNSMRSYAVEASDSLLRLTQRLNLVATNEIVRVLEFAAWIVGEYAHEIPDPRHTLDLLLLIPAHSPPKVLCAFLQAVLKVLTVVLGEAHYKWTSETQARTMLVLKKVTNFVEALVEHPHLEVQERAVGFSELIKISIQATEAHKFDGELGPLLLFEVLPSLFAGEELKPVASSAQKKIPSLPDFEIELPFNKDLDEILQKVNHRDHSSHGASAVHDLYYARIDLFGEDGIPSASTDINTVWPDATIGEEIREDPFYIGRGGVKPSKIPPSHPEFKLSSVAQEPEVESIPIMELDLRQNNGDKHSTELDPLPGEYNAAGRAVVAAEETIDDGQDFGIYASQQPILDEPFQNHKGRSSNQRPRKIPLQVDSSGIGSFSLTSTEKPAEFRHHTTSASTEDSEIALALAKVERMRMEMQRESERVKVASDLPAGGALVKKKKKRVRHPEMRSRTIQESASSAANSKKDVRNDTEVELKKRNKKKRPKDPTDKSTSTRGDSG